MTVKLKLIFFVIVIFSLDGFCQEQEPSAQEILNRIEKKIAKINAFEYEVLIKKKGFPDSDTTYQKNRVKLVRNNLNRNYKFDWEIEEEIGKSPFVHIFIENDFYFVNRKIKSFAIYSDSKKLKEGSYSKHMRITNIFDEILFKTSYKEKKIIQHSSEIKDSTNWVLEYQNEKGTERIWINKKTYIPMRKEEYFEYENLNSIIISQIINLRINEEVEEPKIDTTKFAHGFTKNYVKSNNENEENKIITNWELELRPDQISKLINAPLKNDLVKNYQIAKTNSKLILIDFWFLSCIPCLKSMPDLQKLSEKYKEVGLEVIGINWMDKDNIEGVIQKIRELGINYQNYFTERKLLDYLEINSYPTVILMTPDGDVKYFGFHQNYQILEDLILINL